MDNNDFSNTVQHCYNQSGHCRNARRSITGSPGSCKAIGRKLLAFRRNILISLFLDLPRECIEGEDTCFF